MDYLKIPLDWPAALKGTLARCTPEESIAQNIMLLIVSHPGEIFKKKNMGRLFGSWNSINWLKSEIGKKQ